MSTKRPATMRVEGSARLRRILRRAEPAARSEVATATRDIAERILGAQQQLVSSPGRYGTGALRQALTYRAARSGLTARIGLITPRLRRLFFYARFLEYGTKEGGHEAHPRAARPFIGPSYVMFKDIYLGLAKRGVARALDAAVRGAGPRP